MRLSRLALVLVALSACKDSPSAPPRPGPPAALVVTGSAQSVRAGTAVTSPIVVRVQDANSRGVPGQTVVFEVTGGGGSLAGVSATTDAEGNATLPAWTLGKSAIPQTVHASLGTLSADISATIATSYGIDVRFYGAPMSAEHQALFTNAAARIGAIVTGEIINVSITEARSLNECVNGGPTTPVEVIDDVVIYAAVQDIDGPGKILAQAGPCLIRSSTPDVPVAMRGLPVVGVMTFDIADLATLAGGGRLQDVITHEMLHVLGIGTLWRGRGLLADAGLETTNYTGVQGRSGCVQAGGSAPCAASVPVENTGGSGTRDGHWRESVFDSELMTGYAERGDMPLSFLTIGALADLGYVVNSNASDPYTVPVPAAIAAKVAAEPRETWEREVTPSGTITPSGRVEPLARSGPRRLP